MPGKLNLKQLAIRQLKADLGFKDGVLASNLPNGSIEDWSAAAHNLLSIRLIGLSTLRYFAKNLQKARAHWTRPKQIEILNAVSDRFNKAEQACLDRAAARAENRKLRDIVEPGKNHRTGRMAGPSWRPGDTGRPPVGVKDAPAPPSQGDPSLIWKKMLEQQEQQNDSKP